MAAVMILYCNGKLVNQCDARCYNAEHPACSCCCGGANHGVGLKQAVINAQTMGKRYAAEYATEQGYAPRQLHLSRPIPRELLLQLMEI